MSRTSLLISPLWLLMAASGKWTLLGSPVLSMRMLPSSFSFAPSRERYFPKNSRWGVFVPDGHQEIADALAAQVGIREQDSGIASLPPAGRMAVRR